MKQNHKFSKIAVSGKICSGKSTLVQDLIQHLGWEGFSTGKYLRKYAQEHDLSLENAEEQKKGMTQQIDTMLQDFLASKKPGIADAWMSGIMGKDFPHVLRVLLVCDDAERFKRFADREKTSLKEAKKRVLHRETRVLEEVKKVHGRDDIFDPKHYNMVIDTTSKNPQDVLQEVLDYANF